MSKVFNMVIFSTVLIFLFHVAGFNTDSSWIMTHLNILNLVGLNTSSFWVLLISLFGVIGIGTAAIGSFFNVSPQYILKSSIIMPVLVLLIFDVINVLTYVSGWVYWIVLGVVAPMAAGWIIALIEFWEARD